MTRPAVLITGAARRIGAEIARAFGDNAWHVVVHYGSSQAEAEALADSLPLAETIQCDLADGNAARLMVEELAKALGDWRVLINCASIFPEDRVTGLDPATNARAMQVNATTPALMAQAFLTLAQARGGRRVIHITDQKLANPNPDFFSYTMSKQALAATVPMLAMGSELAEDRIYAIAPGAILPSYDQSEAEFDISGKLNLLNRRTGPDEIARTALFLAEGWIASGTTVFVDSGQHLQRHARDVIYLAREGEQA